MRGISSPAGEADNWRPVWSNDGLAMSVIPEWAAARQGDDCFLFVLSYYLISLGFGSIRVFASRLGDRMEK